MKPPFDFSDHFNGRSMKAAVFLCGSTVASALIGMDVGGIATLIDQGLSHVMPHVPFMETGAIINSYFSGIHSWVGGVALGLFEWARDVGGDAIQAASHGIVEIRNALGPRAGELRDFFTEALRTSMDAGAAYLSSVRDNIARDPAGVVTAVGDALTKAVEVFGVAKGLHEAYKYAKAKILGDTTPYSEPNTGESSGAGPAQNVTNIHLNISLGNAQDVGEAVDGLVRSVRNSANPEILTDHLIKTLTPKHEPLTADSPVAGSDIRTPKSAKPSSSDNIFDMLEDKGRDALRFDVADLEAGTPLISSDDVLWCSDTFCRDLKDGVRRTLSGQLSQEQLNETISSLSRSRKPLAAIEGGLILSATPRGELVTTPLSQRKEHGSGLLIQ